MDHSVTPSRSMNACTAALSAGIILVHKRVDQDRVTDGDTLPAGVGMALPRFLEHVGESDDSRPSLDGFHDA
jgi:hypothetical protein